MTGFSLIANPVLSHLNKRGVLTIYWVINQDDELEHILKNTTVSTIMTDRPQHVLSLLKH